MFDLSKRKNNDWQPIKLSARVFGHISQGLYRTPAGAIKELISNAFDADAGTVRINTGFPRFDVFSCEDTGVGLSVDEFKRLMERGLGTSDKHADPDRRTPLKNRLLIGRLGIGLLSLAQICTEFDIVSHHERSKKAFRVRLKFPPYTREVIDKRKVKDGFVEGGEYKFDNIPFDSSKAGVRIYTRNLRESFRRRMSDLSRYRNQIVSKTKAPYKEFPHFIDGIYSGKHLPKALSMVSDYDQLVFGLGLIPALPYIDDNHNIMLSIPSLKKYQDRLVANDFRLYVDNMEVLRPIRLPSDKLHRTPSDCEVGEMKELKFPLNDGAHGETVKVNKHTIRVTGSDEKFSAYEFKYHSNEVAGKPLTFWGYLFQQTSRIFPRELQGVLVRIRDVAIGSYDNSMMSYPTAEGPRYSMVSGEIIVEVGFEDALNIDRDSFNTLHPHYLRMQAYLHGMLSKHVFREAWEEEKTRNKDRRERAKVEREKGFVQILKDSTDGKFRRIEKHRPDDPSAHQPVEFSAKDKTVIINANHPLLERALRKRKHEELAQQIIVAFERALRESKSEKAREVFYQILSDVFEKYS